MSIWCKIFGHRYYLRNIDMVYGTISMEYPFIVICERCGRHKVYSIKNLKEEEDNIGKENGTN